MKIRKIICFIDIDALFYRPEQYKQSKQLYHSFSSFLIIVFFFFILPDLLCRFEVSVNGTNSFEQAQICCGGVDVREVDAQTMESKKVKGLYFAGEILDVDGICGGYNLQWAWSSGAAAGKCAGRESDK